jgi:hypothetical protein
MDIIHSQILEMREAYFSLPSTQGMFLVDGQVGFSVSVRFTPPRAASIFAALVAPFVDVRFSLELECRTVLCRAIFGTDVASAEVEDVVSGGVVNAPAILWKIFNKLLLMQANAEE